MSFLLLHSHLLVIQNKLEIRLTANAQRPSGPGNVNATVLVQGVSCLLNYNVPEHLQPVDCLFPVYLLDCQELFMMAA